MAKLQSLESRTVCLLLAVVYTVLAPTLTFAQAASQSADPHELFETRVRPLLAKNCFVCHNASRMGGLEMTSRETLLKGGASGPAIVPGHPENSLLIQAVKHQHPKLKMPPPPMDKLGDGDIEALVEWVRLDAVWPTAPVVTSQAETGSEGESQQYVLTPEQKAYWAFQPIRKPLPPVVRDKAWPRNDIDRFILAKLEEKGLTPVRPADRRTLIRRATLDLIGLPPTPEEVDAFVNDPSQNAFEKVVDRLLASPHYGERWGRYWLDIARYADSKAGFFEDPYPNAFRYRDWVIQAFNEDMPYDLFIKAQLAADLLPVENREKLLPALGFHALGNFGFGNMINDDRVDVVTRGVLAMTVACAQCHDHKYDPIPTTDYYSLLGVFRSTKLDQIPLAPASEVQAYEKHKKRIEDMEAVIRDFEQKQNNLLTDILMKQTSRYLVAAWKVTSGAMPNSAAAAAEAKVDAEILGRWIEYLGKPDRDHSYLDDWFKLIAGDPTLEQVKAAAAEFQATVLAVHLEKQAIDDRNYVLLGGAAGVNDDKTRRKTELEFLDGSKGRLWSDLAAPPFMNVGDGIMYPAGIYYYGPQRMPIDEAERVRQLKLAASGTKPKREKQPIERFLYGEWKVYFESLYAQLQSLKDSLPPVFPFLHAVGEAENPGNVRLAIRGDANNLGDEVPRRFLTILCDGDCEPFTQGSGRLELAEAIANPKNPLTARVLVNRVWAQHFGRGIVGTPSNFGLLGGSPSHPDLLDHLASRFIENKWSHKQLHREIMLSATYALSTDYSAENAEKDVENRFHWQANLIKRLDIEALRDSLLAVAGELDRTVGGPPLPLEDENNHRRTVYSVVNRRKLDGTLSLFDFPDPSATSEGRMNTVGPLQRLFFMNSNFVASQAEALAERLNIEAPGEDTARVTQAYRILFGRLPNETEKQLGLQFLQESKRAWPEYLQVLLGSSEFMSVN